MNKITFAFKAISSLTNCWELAFKAKYFKFKMFCWIFSWLIWLVSIIIVMWVDMKHWSRLHWWPAPEDHVVCHETSLNNRKKGDKVLMRNPETLWLDPRLSLQKLDSFVNLSNSKSMVLKTPGFNDKILHKHNWVLFQSPQWWWMFRLHCSARRLWEKIQKAGGNCLHRPMLVLPGRLIPGWKDGFVCNDQWAPH